MANLVVAIQLAGEDKGGLGLVKNAHSALSALEGAVKGPLGAIGGLTSALGGIGLAGMGVGVITNGLQALGGALATPINRASDLAEAVSKNEVVFGKAADTIKAFAETSARSLGQSKAAVFDAAGTFGNLFTASGVAQTAAAGLSKNIITLGSDLASFNNLKPEEVLDKLRAGLLGEAEPMRSLGISINEATVKAKGMQLGLADAHGELSEGAKIQARYALVMEQTKSAQGDFARTSTGMANASRIISASFDDMIVQIGNRLLPIVAPLISNFAQALPTAMDILESAMDSATPFITALGDILTSVANTVVDFIKSSGDIGLLGDNLREAFGIDITPFIGAFQQLVDTFFNVVAIIEQVNTRVQTFFESLVGGQTLATAVNAAFGDLIPASLNSTLDFIDQEFKALKQTLLDLIEGAITLVNTAVAGMAQAWADHGASIQASVSELWGYVTSIFQSAISVISGLMSQTQGEQTTAWQTILGIVRDVFPIILGIVDTALKTLVEGIKVALASITQFWKDHGTEITTVARTLWEGIQTVINDVLVPLVQFIGEQLKAIWQLYVDNKDLIDGTVKALWEAIVTVFSSNLEFISSAVTTALSAIRGFWDAHGEDVKRIARDMWDIVKNTVQTSLDLIGGIIKAAMQLINGDWDGAWNTLTETAKKVSDDIQKIVKSGMDILVTIIKGVARDIANLASEFFTAARNLGQSVIDGLSAALRDGASIVVHIAEDIIRSAIESARKILRQGSPSKVFYIFGESIIDGLVYGMRDGIPDVQLAISDVLNTTLQAFDTFHNSLSAKIAGWGSEISPLNPAASQKMVSDLNRLQADFENATRGFQATAIESIAELNANVADEIGKLVKDAGKAIVDAQNSSAKQIKDTLQGRIEALTLRGARNEFSEGQKVESIQFRRDREDAEAAFNLQRDLARAAADEEKRLAKDVARAKSETEKANFAAQSAARLKDTQNQIQERAKITAEDSAHRRELEDKDAEFAKQQAADRQKFEDKIADDALKKRIEAIKGTEQERISAIREKLSENLTATTTEAIGSRDEILSRLTTDLDKAQKDFQGKIGNIISNAGINIPAFQQAVINEMSQLAANAVGSVKGSVAGTLIDPEILARLGNFSAAFAQQQALGKNVSTSIGEAALATGYQGPVKIFNLNLTGSPVTVDEAELMRMIGRLELLSNAS